MKKIIFFCWFSISFQLVFSQDNINDDSNPLKLKNFFSLAIGGNYSIYSTVFETPFLNSLGYNFSTGYQSANMMLDVKISTPLGEFQRKWSENSFRGIDGEPLSYNIMYRSGISNFKHNVSYYCPRGLIKGLSILFRGKSNPIRSMTIEMLLPDYFHEELNGVNLNLKRTEMFGLYGAVGYSNTIFNNTNSNNQIIEGQLTKLYLISLTNIIKRSWTDQILYINTMVAKQKGNSHKTFLHELNESYNSFFHRLIPMPLLDLYFYNEEIKITNSDGNVMFSSPGNSGSISYNVGVGWINYIAIPTIRTLIIPSFYYYFIDTPAGGNLIEQSRYNASISFQLFL